MAFSPWSQLLASSYPDPGTWPKEQTIPKQDVFRFARLWLSEGIPFAFKDNPIAFEIGREQLAKHLDEDPKHFSLTGSARLGFALSPKRFSRPFQPTSDFDLFAVSPGLFERLHDDAMLFIDRVENGQAIPRTNREKQTFPQNVIELKQVRQKRYLNSNRIPIAPPYPTRNRVSNGLVAFNDVVSGNPDGIGCYARISLRVYQDWDAAVSQIGGSLLRTLKELGYQIDEPNPRNRRGFQSDTG